MFGFDFCFKEDSLVFESEVNCSLDELVYPINKEKIDVFEKNIKIFIKSLDMVDLELLFEKTLSEPWLDISYSEFFNAVLDSIHELCLKYINESDIKIKLRDPKRKCEMDDFLQLENKLLSKIKPNFLFLTLNE